MSYPGKAIQAALSKTRLAGEGQLKEIGAGYTLFWSGRNVKERRESGMGFAMKNCLVSKLASLPQNINDRLMTLRLPLTSKQHVTIINAYAPTMTNPEEVTERLYDDLDKLIRSVPRNEKLFILGDLNVTTDQTIWGDVNGVRKCNSNGLMLLITCAVYELLIKNTVFHLPHRNRTSWMHPRSRHWHLIDFIQKEG